MPRKGGVPENLKPFRKGKDERRNAKGRPPKIPSLDTLINKVLGEEKDNVTAIEVILMALRSKATKGDIRAAEVLLERAYGKPKSEIDVTSGGEKVTSKINELSFEQLMALAHGSKNSNNTGSKKGTGEA